MSLELPQIRTGHFSYPATVRDYRFERLGEMLVERALWWPPLSADRWLSGSIICYRFWLLAYDQVVERHFAVHGVSVGTHIDLCSPLVCDETACSARDYLLDIRISSTGEVTVHNEAIYEEAIRRGLLDCTAAKQAERHFRMLTAGIARGRFPPPIVRNWQVDLNRIATEDPSPMVDEG